MMKLLKFIGPFAMILFFACTVWGKGTAGVASTVHNLSAFGPSWQYAHTNTDEICVFCHTPHGGLLAGPLWNHDLPDAASFTHYNSATLSTYLQSRDVNRNLNYESLICMACHDGSVAVNHLVNNPNYLIDDGMGAASGPWFWGFDTPMQPGFDGTPKNRIGGKPGDEYGTGFLSDDHPISFSYDAVYAEYQSGPRIDDLRSVAVATAWGGEGVRFFAPGNRVECSSCHDPHVNYVADTAYTPFLIRPNTGSNLCLSCHNK